MAREKTSIDWSQYSLRKIDFTIVLVFHLLAIAGIFYITWSSALAAVVLWVFTGMLGITVCYHRLLCHKSFETYPIVRAIHLFAAALSFQRGPLTWSKHHLRHHQNSDQEDDPYFPQHGFWFCHIGWVIFKRKARYKKSFELPQHIKNDRLNLFFEKYNLPIFALSLVALYLIGGVEFVLVAGFLRVVLVLHFTWLVNSWSHRFGYRNFSTTDESSNSPLVAILAFGEGWHNNHHMYPRSARHGMQAWEFDPSFYWIKALEFCGLAWNIQTTTVKAKRLAEQNAQKA
ncbi:acyl-CoA desaturase [bacterium]|nr:acyl-CoA desaturase [bacterium]